MSSLTTGFCNLWLVPVFDHESTDTRNFVNVTVRVTWLINIAFVAYGVRSVRCTVTLEIACGSVGRRHRHMNTNENSVHSCSRDASLNYELSGCRGLSCVVREGGGVEGRRPFLDVTCSCLISGSGSSLLTLSLFVTEKWFPTPHEYFIALNTIE